MNPIIEIPIVVPSTLSIILLFVSAFFVEIHYVGRLAMASNIFLAWQLLGGMWYELPELVQMYLNVGLIMAALVLFSYISKTPIPTVVYKMGRLFFGAISVILVLIYVFLVYL